MCQPTLLVARHDLSPFGLALLDLPVQALVYWSLLQTMSGHRRMAVSVIALLLLEEERPLTTGYALRCGGSA